MQSNNHSTIGIVVIAAGKGTRMKSDLPKVLHPLCGRPLIGHVLGVADTFATSSTVVVLSRDTIASVRTAMGDHYTYVTQTELLGTGHAVLQARDALQGKVDQVLILYGDTPLIRSETAQELLSLQRESSAFVGLLSFHADPPTGYGRVLRNAAGHVIELIEERNATPEQRAITEVNAGMMCFDAAWLWSRIDAIKRNPLKGEYYLTDLVAMAVDESGPGVVVAHRTDTPYEAWGINDRAQLAAAEAVLRAQINDHLMRSGVTIVDPAATYIDVDVEVGQDTTLLPGTLLRGATRVGAGCEIGPYTTVIGATIGDRARVRYALVEADVAPGVTIEPFTHIGCVDVTPSAQTS
jgi:bifunctional UDP-N-acetylglucosamine pyrophosphorylase/glucosamine-1-phosphate N-acetyltransferase